MHEISSRRMDRCPIQQKATSFNEGINVDVFIWMGEALVHILFQLFHTLII